MTKSNGTYLPLKRRPLKRTLCLFDIDGTLCLEKQLASPEVLLLLSRLRQKCLIGYVSGGPLSKQQYQLSVPSVPVTSMFDFCFPENGVIAYRLGRQLPGPSIIDHLGDHNYGIFIDSILEYLKGLNISTDRTDFIDLRTGNINISLIGQGASYAEMEKFCEYDQIHGVRKDMIRFLQQRFADLNLVYTIGGKSCFDTFPSGWDKTFCLNHLLRATSTGESVYDEIHFFGDKVMEGGNDFELYNDERIIGHSVTGPDDTIRQIKELFEL